MSRCKIHLENYSGVYYPSSEIRGRVECYFNDNITIRGIKVRLKCKEFNEWRGTESYYQNNKRRTRTITLRGDRNVIYVEKMLHGSASGNHVIHRGHHEYPFSFTLSHDIPATFEGPYGGIAYKIKAVVDIPMAFDYEDDFIFVVTSPINFTQMSRDLQETSTYSDEKTVCCWCCAGGNISMDVELPKVAFVPGEIIPFKVHVKNLSNSNVEKLGVKFLKTLTYKVTSPRRESKNDVEKIVTFTEHGVGAHGEHTYDLKLVIPPYIEVPNFAKCDLFSAIYNLVVNCEMPACTLDLEVPVWDIQMGHVQCPERYDEAMIAMQPPNANVSPGSYLPPPLAGAYPNSAGDASPPAYPPPAYPSPPAYPPPAYPSSFGVHHPPGGAFASPIVDPSEKPVYSTGQPSAPTIAGPSAPILSGPTAPPSTAPIAPPSAAPIAPSDDLSPPSYGQVQHNYNSQSP